MLRRPRALRNGDRVAIVAPASPFDRDRFESGVAELRDLGLQPVFDDRVFERQAYVAGSAPSRAESFRAAWRDPSVAAVVAARGGYGSAQLLPLLDAEELRHRPKALVGCSDLTALLTFLTIQCGVVGFHGPMVVSLADGRGGYDRGSLLGQLSRPVPFGPLPDGDGVEVLRRGRARGRLLGGTLTQLVGSLGTPFAFDPPPGFVLLLDDVGERPYRIDRMLTQLRQAGVLARAAAVVCAEFPDCAEPDAGVDARAVLAGVSADIDGPVLFGVPTGHTRARPMVTLPLGVEVTVDTDGSGRLIVEEAAVA